MRGRPEKCITPVLPLLRAIGRSCNRESLIEGSFARIRTQY